MLSERAFRAQLVTQGQRELYDYWRETAGLRLMPARSDINPFSVPKLLPYIGLIDLSEGLAEAQFRLAGTRLRDVYGEEITGKRIDGCLPALARTIGGTSMPASRTRVRHSTAWSADRPQAATISSCSGCDCRSRRMGPRSTGSFATTRWLH